MGDMTDAFMTAAVLMAVANGTSEITNIANQRVKESNRIAVMVEGSILPVFSFALFFFFFFLKIFFLDLFLDLFLSFYTELGKCGVQASELPDGIKITGALLSTLKGATIACHDDHRIAMSFAVFGCVVPGIIISDKACVEKTYPEFWDDIEHILSVRVKVPRKDRIEQVEKGRKGEHSTKTLVLIGMRGAGKTSMGRAVTAAIGDRVFIDMDYHFEKVKGMTIMDFVKENSWPSFREQERTLLEAVLKEHPTGAVVSCGGGIVETEEGRKILKKVRFSLLLLLFFVLFGHLMID
jgi:pentafunctional AROM polypeptide